jgi:transposase-like protein
VARRAIGEWINTTVLGKFMVMSQPWSADAYAEHAGYVPAFGTEWRCSRIPDRSVKYRSIWRDVMTRQMRRRFSPEYKEQAVARLLAPGATQASVAAELGVTPTQLKTWRLELEAAGSASAIERQQAEAGELARLRQDNKRLKEEVEVLRKASAFFAQWAAKT